MRRGNTLRIGLSEVNSQVKCEAYPKTRPGIFVYEQCFENLRVLQGGLHTCDNLWALKVLVRMNIAGGQSQVETQKDQKEICSSPHIWEAYEVLTKKQMTGRDNMSCHPKEPGRVKCSFLTDAPNLVSESCTVT